MPPENPAVIQIISLQDLWRLKRSLSALIRKLKEKGIPSEIICIREKNDAAVKVRSHELNIEFWDKDKGFDFGLVKRLDALIKQRKARILHVHSPSLFAYTALLSLFNRVAIVITINGLQKKRMSRWPWYLAKFIIFTSQEMRS